MDSTRYINRVGALAVALGIGTALASGTGIAWADDGGNSGKTNSRTSSNDGKSGARNTNSSAGSSAVNSSAAKKPTASGQGSHSKLGDRVRKDVESGLDGVGDALKRSHSQTVGQVGSQMSKPRTRTTNSAAGTTGITPAAVDAVPELSHARRADAVPMKTREATDNITRPVTKALGRADAETPVEPAGPSRRRPTPRSPTAGSSRKPVRPLPLP